MERSAQAQVRPLTETINALRSAFGEWNEANTALIHQLIALPWWAYIFRKSRAYRAYVKCEDESKRAQNKVAGLIVRARVDMAIANREWEQLFKAHPGEDPPLPPDPPPAPGLPEAQGYRVSYDMGTDIYNTLSYDETQATLIYSQLSLVQPKEVLAKLRYSRYRHLKCVEKINDLLEKYRGLDPENRGAI